MRRKGDKRPRTEAQMVRDRKRSKSSNRCCCFIPDQKKLDEGCQNPAVYQIWEGNDPTPDDYTESCAKHLEQMLDDSTRFEVFRIKE